jgi:4'-phosphopantetheinyl transferase
VENLLDTSLNDAKFAFQVKAGTIHAYGLPGEIEETTLRADLGDIQQACANAIGPDGMNGLQAARILVARGVPVIAIAKDPKHHPSRTRVCKEILFADTEGMKWVFPSNRLALKAHEIHIWRITLDQSDWLGEHLRQWLAPDEWARADRFHFDHDRARFIVMRGALRSILGGYLGTEPSQLQFVYGPHGKPALATSCGQLCFNVSHSERLGLCAISRHSEIGVDLEYVHSVAEAELIAERFFSSQEKAMLQSLPVNQRQAAFFNCWTRKEAFIKAIGEGLSHPLNQFDVAVVPGDPARFLSIGGDAQEARRWSLYHLSPGEGYTGALAAKGNDWQLSGWEWRMPT